MVVQHNITSMNSNRMLGITSDAQAKSTEKLSSGYKINRAADDAAGLSISEKMRKQIRGLTQASTNAEDGISAVQTAEGALTEVHDMLQRMNELAVKAANGTMSSSDKADVHNEIKQLSTEIDRVATTTKFNETYLLSGSASGKSEDANWRGSLSFALQVGADNKANNRITVNIYSISASSLGVGVNDNLKAADIVEKYHYGVNDNGSIVKIDGRASTDDSTPTTKHWTNNGTEFIKAGSILPIGAISNNNNDWTNANIQYDASSSVTLTDGSQGPKGGGYISTKTTSTARAAIDNISAAIKLVSARRSALGAVQNRLEHTIKNLDNVVENTTAAESTIRDTDMAAEMVTYSKNNILQQAGQSMLAQANQSNQGVLSLLQ
ncbi:MAG: flagellin [Lachnospiraceae bacterium]|nr:flagellin [Lachnospiraceae bacterium]